MAEIISLVAERALDLSNDVVLALRGLADKIEKGEFGGLAERWIIVLETTSPDGGTFVRSHRRDSGLTIAEAVYMLETAKFDVLTLSKTSS